MTKEPVGSGTAALGQPGSVGASRSEQPTAADIVVALDLMPHREGGYFRETYRATATVATTRGERSASTAILYLLTDSEASRFHRLRSDELWFYHAGASAEPGLAWAPWRAHREATPPFGRPSRAPTGGPGQPVRAGSGRVVGGGAAISVSRPTGAMAEPPSVGGPPIAARPTTSTGRWSAAW